MNAVTGGAIAPQAPARVKGWPISAELWVATPTVRWIGQFGGGQGVGFEYVTTPMYAVRAWPEGYWGSGPQVPSFSAMKPVVLNGGIGTGVDPNVPPTVPPQHVVYVSVWLS